MCEEAKFDQTDCVEGDECYQTRYPQGYSQRIAYVCRSEVEARLSFEVLAAMRTRRVHLRERRELVRIAFLK